MITISMAALPPEIQHRIRAALAAGDTAILTDSDGTVIASITRPGKLPRGFQIGDGNTQVNQF